MSHAVSPCPNNVTFSVGECFQDTANIGKRAIASRQQDISHNTERMDYTDKTVLAPMVRVGTLPLRLLASEYGANIVYSEELVDHKMILCDRQVNATLGSVDFVEKGTNSVHFRTCDEEKGRVVLQIGTSDAVRALRVAELVCRDVATVDINMGCPKQFSISGGMGAALLSKPEVIHDILTTLKRNLSIPVTCKIRLLKSREATVDLARMIESTGVSALAVHGRKVADRPRDPAQWSEIRAVVDALKIPVIANGDVSQFGDVERIKKATGAAAVMIARGACWNPSVFSPHGLEDWRLVKRKYLRKCVLWDNDLKSTKHMMKEMIMHYSNLEWAEGKGVNRSRTYEDLCNLYGQHDYYKSLISQRSVMEATSYNGIYAPSIPVYKLPSLDCSVQLWEPTKLAA